MRRLAMVVGMLALVLLTWPVQAIAQTAPNGQPRLEVVQYFDYELGRFYIPRVRYFSGELKNTGSAPATNIRVTVNLFDGNQLLYSALDKVIPPFAVLQPGELIGFVTILPFNANGWDRVVFDIQQSTYDPANPLTQKPITDGFTVSNQQTHIETNNRLAVSGDLTNNSGKNASVVYVIATSYDGNKLIDVRSGSVERGAPLPNGEIGHFQVTNLSVDTDRYRFFIVAVE